MKVTVKLALFLVLSIGCCYAQAIAPGTIQEFAIAYPSHPPNASPMCNHAHGSTHEITFNENGGDALWITGQNEDAVVRVALDGKMSFYKLPSCSGPHGIEFDKAGRLWVSLEFAGKIVRFDANGKIDLEYDVRLNCDTCARKEKINTAPHGMGFGSDGRTIWFTGKATGTIGKITPDGKIETFRLSTASVPIYIKAGPDGSMWITELVGNKIGCIRPDGSVEEFAIFTPNSRPIAIVPEPGGEAMWFSEEAGNKVGRIDMKGNITEFPVPKTQDNVILAGLGFDSENNLWVQQYVNQSNPNNPSPAGPDYIIKIDKTIRTATPSDISRVPFTFYKLPTSNTVMHRIIKGPDGNMWFTEMHVDKVGKLNTGLPR